MLSVDFLRAMDILIHESLKGAGNIAYGAVKVVESEIQRILEAAKNPPVNFPSPTPVEAKSDIEHKG